MTFAEKRGMDVPNLTGATEGSDVANLAGAQNSQLLEQSPQLKANKKKTDKNRDVFNGRLNLSQLQ